MFSVKEITNSLEQEENPQTVLRTVNRDILQRDTTLQVRYEATSFIYRASDGLEEYVLNPLGIVVISSCLNCFNDLLPNLEAVPIFRKGVASVRFKS